MKFANQLGYSDVEPHEVLRVIGKKTLLIREMTAIRDNSIKLDFQVGGFCAHCTNQRDQKWFISSDETARVFRIRLQKNGLWKDSQGRRFSLNEIPIKFYDYNF